MWKRRDCGVLAQILVLFLAVVPVVKSIWFEVPFRGGIKCVSEELRRDVVVLAHYYVIPTDDDSHVHTNSTPAISVKVTSPYGNDIHHQENVTYGQFAFTTTEDGTYLACFSIVGDYEGGKSVTVSIDWKTGIAAKDWDSVAKKEKIEGLQLELVKLEGAVDAIRENLIYLKNREAEMREVGDRTNARVARFSLMSAGVCILVSLLQVGYLRRFFQKKKLI